MLFLHSMLPSLVHIVIAHMLGTPPGTPLTIPGLGDFLNSIAATLFGFGTVLCVLGIIVGGMMRATAFGSERRIAASNIALSCAVVGFLIILLAQPIGSAIFGAFPK